MGESKRVAVPWHRMVCPNANAIQDEGLNGIERVWIPPGIPYGEAVRRVLALYAPQRLVVGFLEHDVAADYTARALVSAAALHADVASGWYWVYTGRPALPQASTRSTEGHGTTTPGPLGSMGWGFWAIRATPSVLAWPWETWEYPDADTRFSAWARTHGVHLEGTGAYAVHLREWPRPKEGRCE